MPVDQPLGLGLAYAVLLLLGLMQFGRWVVKALEASAGLTWQYAGQQLVLGAAVVSVAVSWGSVIALGPAFYRIAAGVLMAIGLLGGCIALFEASRVIPQWRLPRGWVAGCTWTLMLLYGLANIGLVSNADSLDYHLGYALNYLRQPFESYPEWYTGRMAQSGEQIIALGLAVQSQAFAGLFQYAGLVALTALMVNMPRVHIKVEAPHASYSNWLLTLAWLSSPVLLFLATSAKPQLMPTAMSGLAFVLVARTLLGEFSRGERPNARSVLPTLLLTVALASVAASHKSSFLISLAVLGCLSTYTAYRLGNMRRFLLWSIVIGLVVFLPVYWDKFQRYQTTPFVFFASPVGGFNDSLSVFLTWVKNYRENQLPFPLYWVLPSSPGNFTTVLGLGVMLAGYGLFQWDRSQRTQITIRPLLLLLAAFVGVLWLVGQPSARFYLEPYVWALLLLAMRGMSLAHPLLRRATELALVGQTFLVMVALSFYVWGVISSFAPGGQVAFLTKFVNGYDLHQWIDQQLPADAAILLDHRSKAMTRRVAVSTDPIEFLGQDGVELQQLERALTMHRVQFAVTRHESPVYRLLASCSTHTVAGPETLHLASRNPFNAGGSYQAYIFSIEPSALIRCIEQHKRSLHS